jgi:hypothetical protein
MSEKFDFGNFDPTAPKVPATLEESITIIANTLLERGICGAIWPPAGILQDALADTKEVPLHAQGRAIPADIEEMILRRGPVAEAARGDLIQGLRELVTEAVVKLDATELVRAYLKAMGPS